MTSAPGQSRRWLVALPLIVVLLLAVAWSGFWFYAAARADGMLAEWRAREAEAGRDYSCEQQSIGGFPFRFELLCRPAAASLASNEPKVALTAAQVRIAGQVYDPTLLIAEVGAPLTIAVAGEQPVRARWSLLQISIRGRPPAPERVSMAIDDAGIDRPEGQSGDPLLRAKRIELHGRVASGSVRDRPVLDLAATLGAFMAPTVHPMLQQPLDVSMTGTLRGLDNLRPLPLPARLRQLQAAGGRLEIKQARIQQGDVLAVAAGSLGLTQDGRLDGELTVTAAGLDRALPKLGIDKLMPSTQALEPTFGALDRLIPGLGRVARNRAGTGLAVGLALIGTPAELEGRKAISVPLRLVDGTVFLGPVKVGAVAPLF
jgi:hypothetical protein